MKTMVHNEVKKDWEFAEKRDDFGDNLVTSIIQGIQLNQGSTQVIT